MHRKSFLIATLLLGSFAVLVESQERGSSPIHWRGGRSLEKELASIPNNALPLLLAIEVPRESILAGENFPIRFVLTNPNSIALRVTKIGWERPRLFAGIDDEIMRSLDRSGGLHAGGVMAPVLGPGESATAVVTMFPGSVIVQTFYAEVPYTLRLRGAGVVQAVATEEPRCPKMTCKWESEEIQISVRAPTTHERKAYQTILDWNETQVEMHQAIVDRNRARGVPALVSGEEWTLAMIDFRRRFLNEYGDTPYANQVRVHLLRDLADLPREKSGIDAEPLPPFFPLYLKTVSELLDAGLPYASKIDRGVLETLGMGGRWDMVATALEKLLGTDPSERTLDHTFATVAREYGVILRPKTREYVGEAASKIEERVLPCIARCAAWESFRAVPFDRRTFAFLSEIKRWNLLELTAQRTLEATRAGQDCGGRPPSRRVVLSDETIAAAREALDVARRKQDAQR